MTKITLAAVGDISFAKLPEKLYNANVTYDFFADVKEALAKADIRFGNLESVMVPDDFPLEQCCGRPLQSRDKLIHALEEVKFDILQTASNHALDCGWRGLLNTIEKVKSIGVQTLASGKDQTEARSMRVIEKNGIRIGFIGYVQAGDWTLAGGGGRLAYLNEADAVADVQRYRNQVDVLIVSIHADIEFNPAPSMPRVKLFRKIAEAGADLILGHHPHVPQGVERWGNCLINYSLGNFIFDLNGYLIGASENVDRSHIFYVDIVDGKIVDYRREYYKINIDTCSPEKLDAAASLAEDEYFRSLDAILQDPEQLKAAWYASCKRKLGRILQYRLQKEENLTADIFIKKYAHMLFSDMSCEWLEGIKELAYAEYQKHNYCDYEFKYPYSGFLED